MTGSNPSAMNRIQLAVLTARIEGIARKMANTLHRTGRSGILTIARDFSCVILTARHELLTAADRLIVMVNGRAARDCPRSEFDDPDPSDDEGARLGGSVGLRGPATGSLVMKSSWTRGSCASGGSCESLGNWSWSSLMEPPASFCEWAFLGGSRLRGPMPLCFPRSQTRDLEHRRSCRLVHLSIQQKRKGYL